MVIRPYNDNSLTFTIVHFYKKGDLIEVTICEVLMLGENISSFRIEKFLLCQDQPNASVLRVERCIKPDGKPVDPSVTLWQFTLGFTCPLFPNLPMYFL